MKVFVNGRDPVSLTRSDFVGAGGQADVYARGDIAYKVFTDPAGIVPETKRRELSALSDPPFMVPSDMLTDGANIIGHTMRYLPNATPLCAMFPRAFRERNGMTPQQVFCLVEQLRDGVATAHKAGICIVDLNPMNVLLTEDLSEVAFIDVDSHQTPSFPATALQDAVRDRHAPPGVFTQETDWFSFAVVAFQMLIGIHPFKGKHPTVKGMDERMKQGISVLHPDVKIPKVCFPFDVIPADWRSWFEDVFHRHKRASPPVGAGILIPMRTRSTMMPSSKLKIAHVADIGAPLSAFAAHGGSWTAVAAGQIWLDGRVVGQVSAGPVAIGFCSAGKPVVASLQNGAVRLWDVNRHRSIPLMLTAAQIAGHGGRILVRSGDQVLELVLHSTQDRIVATSRSLGTVLPHASRLLDGLVVQNLLGAAWLTISPQPGRSHPVRIPQLDGHQILSGHLSGSVVMLLTERDGDYNRILIRFNNSFSKYDLEIEPDVIPQDPVFICLPSGVLVTLIEDGRLRLTRGSSSRDVVDPAIAAEMKLYADGGTLLGASGGQLYTLRMA